MPNLVPSFDRRVNAIRFPLGENAGASSGWVLNVSWTSALPSAFID